MLSDQFSFNRRKYSQPCFFCKFKSVKLKTTASGSCFDRKSAFNYDLSQYNSYTDESRKGLGFFSVRSIFYGEGVVGVG